MPSKYAEKLQSTINGSGLMIADAVLNAIMKKAHEIGKNEDWDKAREVWAEAGKIKVSDLRIVAYGTEAVVRGATVEKSERVCDGGKEGKCRYLIFTDKGVLKNTDTMLRGKFDSSDLYASIKVNQTYDFTTVGFRVPFFSMYPNVLKAAPVAK